MDKEIKKEALRQYLKYFRIWFIAVGVVVVITIFMIFRANLPSANRQAPEERVYDYAGVLTDSEEEALRRKIAEYEKKGQIDIIIVTLNEPMGIEDAEWEWNMMNYADDFYDNGKFGWNKAHGDGALLLDNWYEDANGSQKGSWLSTSGKMEETIGRGEEKRVLDDMYEYIDRDPYRAYLAAVERLADFGKYGPYGEGDGDIVSAFLGAFVVSSLVALVYLIVYLTPSKGKDTTTAGTYVEGGVPVVRNRSDEFLRKNVVSRRIESNSGGGGGGSSHRGGGSHGSHTSSGGHSHGGGGRRR